MFYFLKLNLQILFYPFVIAVFIRLLRQGCEGFSSFVACLFATKSQGDSRARSSPLTCPPKQGLRNGRRGRPNK
jgi:hypothetical protein